MRMATLGGCQHAVPSIRLQGLFPTQLRNLTETSVPITIVAGTSQPCETPDTR
jgi:hypothetical protein